MKPLRLDEIVSGTGELSQVECQIDANAYTQVTCVALYF